MRCWLSASCFSTSPIFTCPSWATVSRAFSSSLACRLALKELYQETSDHRFAKVWVEISPFKSDFDLALLHDRENTCRGDLTFIEDAWSKYRLYQIFRNTAQSKKTSRAFVDDMRDEQGFNLTVESFSRIKYTVEVLYQHIPTCLVHGGMSLRAVRRLITLRNGLKKAWVARSIGTVAHFDETFYGLLARQDQDLAVSFVRDDSTPDQFPDQRITIDWTVFQQDLQHEISVYAEVPYLKAGAWIAAAFRQIGKSSDVQSAPNTSEPTPSEQGPKDVLELRTAAYAGARRIAAAGDLEHLIQPSDEGFGYQVADEVPETALPQSKACWWALVLATTPADQVSRYAGTAVGAPSFAGLSAEVLSSISALFAHHARIVRKAA